MAEMGEPPREKFREDAGEVNVHTLTIRQGGARSVTAHDVTLRQGGIARLDAHEVDITQGGVALATTERLRLTAGGMGAVLADQARLEQSMAHVVAARERVEMDQAAGAIVVGRTVTVRDSAIGVLLTPHFEGQGVRVLMGPKAALAFGVGVGLVLSLVAAVRRRL